MKFWGIVVLGLIVSVSLGQESQAAKKGFGGFGVHAGVGTDIDLGLGLGVGASYILPAGPGSERYEVGFDYYTHSSTTDEETDYRTSTETVSLQVFGVRFNALFDYDPKEGGIYYILGTGIVMASIDWEYKERSRAFPNSSWTTSSASGSSSGILLNPGLGYLLGSGFEARLELPVLILFDQIGSAPTFAPTLTATIGYRF